MTIKREYPLDAQYTGNHQVKNIENLCQLQPLPVCQQASETKESLLYLQKIIVLRLVQVLTLLNQRLDKWLPK